MKRLPPAPLVSRISDHWPYMREMADRMSQDKRLTDAELAAEFWKAQERCTFVTAFAGGMPLLSDSRVVVQAKILHRFATLPHYDEPAP